MAQAPVRASHGGQPAQVLLVLDLNCQMLAPLELAVACAAASGASLGGILVDDAILQRLVGLPFASEVTLLGAQPRALLEPQLRLARSNFSSRFQRALSAQAKHLAVDYSFTTVEDHQQALAMARTDSTEMLIIGHSGSVDSASSKPVRILVLAAAGAAALHVLSILLRFSKAQTVEVLVVDGDPGNELSKLIEHFPQLYLQRITTAELTGLVNTKGARCLDYVLAPRQTPTASLQKFIAPTRRPIVLLV